MNSLMIYEQPLNERVRNLLRIEYLFNRIHHYSESVQIWDTRLTISLLLELNDLLKRSDILTDLTKELERYLPALSALEGNPGVDTNRLKKVLADVNAYLSVMRDNATQPGASLDSDELITSIKQKSAMAGGASNFDLPAYHHWLSKSAATRQRSLREWQEDLLIVHKGTGLALAMIRNNASLSKEIAEGGFFQKSIESGTSSQLIRIILPANSKYFPEISGGKHRFSVRFMEQPLTANRPVQSEKNVEFELHFCVL